MQYRGHLLLPGESGPGLKVNLDVAEHHLAVESDGGGLGAWPLEAVEVERLHGDLFALNVAGEALRFVADDTIGFAYSGVPAIGNVRRSRGRSGLRSMFGWLKGPDESRQSAGVETPPADRSKTPVVEASLGEDIRESDVTDIRTQPEVTVHTPSAEEPVVDEPVVETQAQSKSTPVPEQLTGETAEDIAQCAGVRSDGERCRSQILTDSGYCYPHDPRRAFEDGYEAAQEARAQLKRDATARLNRIYGRLEQAMRQVERGELDPETAMAMAQLARTMCAILQMDESTTDEV